MHVIDTPELERLVRTNFPAKERFSAESDLGLDGAHQPAVAFVHGGPDRSLDAWLTDGSAFASLYPLLNRLCRVGALVPGEYAITRARPAHEANVEAVEDVDGSGVPGGPPRRSTQPTPRPRPEG